MPFYCTTVGKDTKNERNIKTKYGIALGVAIPNVFARRFINRNKRMKFNKLIEERKDRGDFIYLEDL